MALAGGFLFSIGFLAEKLMKKEAMGFGDVKLLAMCGAWFGLSTTLVGLLFAAFLGTLFGLPMLLLKRLNAENHLPFGPFICFGVLISAIAGDWLMQWYLGLLQF
jgi:leader peptidase (prepilin peptidase) / N-methyltransferase